MKKKVRRRKDSNFNLDVEIMSKQAYKSNRKKNDRGINLKKNSDLNFVLNDVAFEQPG